MKKFKEYIASQFGNPKGLVGKICCIIMNRMNRAMYQSVVEIVTAYTNSRILDIGYGNGYLIHKVHKKSDATIFGIDISKDMLDVATRKNKEAVDNKRVSLSLGDCCDLQFEDGMFDTVVSVNTIYFWNDTLKGLEEINRVLNKNGEFYNVVYSKEWLQKLSYTKKGFKFFEKEDYTKMGKQAGFSKVAIKEIVNGKSYVITYIK